MEFGVRDYGDEFVLPPLSIVADAATLSRLNPNFLIWGNFFLDRDTTLDLLLNTYAAHFLSMFGITVDLKVIRHYWMRSNCRY